MSGELKPFVITEAAALELWFVCQVNDRPWPFTLCSLHGAQTLAKRDALNAALSSDGFSLERFEVPAGALVNVTLPAGVRCAECFGDPPCDGNASEDER